MELWHGRPIPFSLDDQTLNEPKVLTVTRLTQKLQWTLRNSFHEVWVTGEISNLTQPASGHVYLTLADDTAQMKAVIWRSDAESINFDLKNGMEVICRGEIDIYPPRGVYQLIVRHVEPKGVGAQQLALKKLHARLAAEGLFDADRKRPLPSMPGKIAVVTSPSGAAIQDFLQVITRRWPAMEVMIIPARVQGEEAALEIAQGIVVAGLLEERPDVLVVTRGGGSAEDLWSFNDERVVRAIAACEIPVVSGVGHEIDVTLSDLVADVRALTPSEAGELVVPVRSQVVATVNELGHRMNAALLRSAEVARQRLRMIESRRVMTDPEQLLHVARRRVDELELRLGNAGGRNIERCENRMAVLSGRLQAISPLNVLARGYSVTQTLAGETIRRASQVKAGDRIISRLAEGTIESEILKDGE